MLIILSLCVLALWLNRRPQLASLMTLAACLTIWPISWTPCWSNHGNLSPGQCCIGSKRHNGQLSPLKRSLCFHHSFSLSCSPSSHPPCAPSVHQSVLALKYLLSLLFCHPEPPVTTRQTPAAGKRPEKKREWQETGKRRVLTWEDKQIYWEKDSLETRRRTVKWGTQQSHMDFSDFPMEARIHELVLIEQTTV